MMGRNKAKRRCGHASDSRFPVTRRQLLVLTLLLVVAAPAPASGATNGSIAFTSDRDGDDEIYVVNPDGSGATNLTQSAATTDQQPAWSPDGRRIAFVRDDPDDGRWDIFVMNRDGSGQTQLTDGFYLSDDTDPAWSPDGSEIAFASTRPFNDSWQIWVMKADGTNLRRLTTSWGTQPAWSPDGTQIAYVSFEPGGTEAVYVMNADGSGQHRVTAASDHPERAPAWSPDGQRILFGRYTEDWRTSNAHELFAIAPDGSGERELTSGGAYNGPASWSPDGTKIVLQRFFGIFGTPELYVMNADGSGVAPLVTWPGRNGTPDWGTTPALEPPSPGGDTTPPTITIATPSEGAAYELGSVVHPRFRCEDEPGGSGLWSCESDTRFDLPLETSSVGEKRFTVTATDRAGNVASASRTYRVLYRFSGFFAPVENVPAVNAVNAGESLPLRFSLAGDQGLGVLAGPPVWREAACDSGATLATAVARGDLAYNRTHDRYTFTALTEKSWAGACREFSLTLADGTTHRAGVRFTK